MLRPDQDGLLKRKGGRQTDTRGRACRAISGFGLRRVSSRFFSDAIDGTISGSWDKQVRKRAGGRNARFDLPSGRQRDPVGEREILSSGQSRLPS